MDMGRKEERVRCILTVTWKLILRKTDSQWEFAIQQIVSGNRKRGSASTQMGGMGQEMGRKFKREGMYVYLWLIHVEV